jgi:hypothetical protein
MAVVVSLGWRGLGHFPLAPKLRDAIAIFGLIPAGAAVYALALWLLRIEGREELSTLLGKLRAKSS